MSRDTADDETTGGHAKAVWVTPTLTSARVADDTEAKTSSSIEVTSASVKNGS